MRVVFLRVCLSAKAQTHEEKIGLSALLSMTRHSRTASIVCSLATLFILLSPVTGSGYAFDTGTCSEASIEFLTIQIKRAVSIAVNTANILNQDEVPQDITLPIVHMMNEAEPISYIRAVFTGGQVSRQNGQVQQISGIASYTRVLPRFNSKNRGETYPADTQGNMVLVPAVFRVYHLPSNTLIHLIAHIL